MEGGHVLSLNNTKEPKILLVDRGGCSFVTKVRNGERAGASLVVVIDDRFEDIEEVIMSDDGTGSNVRVPSMIIGKHPGHLLKEFAMTGEPISLQASFESKASRYKVDVELWYSSNNAQAMDFIAEFSEHAEQLKGVVDFTPRFVSWGCTTCDTAFKREDCFNDGLYCAPSNVRGGYGSVHGRSILLENIRESCLYSVLETKGTEEKWWSYMRHIHSRCSVLKTEACSKNATETIGESWDELQKCVNASFGNPTTAEDAESENSILAADGD